MRWRGSFIIVLALALLAGLALAEEDADGDSIPNAADTCASTPAGEPVNGQGCSCSQMTCGTITCGTDDVCATYATKQIACTQGVCASREATCTDPGATYNNDATCTTAEGMAGKCSQGTCVLCPTSAANECIDTCGNTLNGFACAFGGGTCQGSSCVCTSSSQTYNSVTKSCAAPTCTPKSKAVACAGIPCGTVSDGCQGSVQCDSTCTTSSTCQSTSVVRTYTGLCGTNQCMYSDTACPGSQTCSNGACSCPAGTTSCGTQCCASGQTCSNNQCSQQTYAVGNVPQSIMIRQGTSQSITPTLETTVSPRPTPAWYATGYVTQAFTTTLAITPSFADIGKTFTIYIAAKSGETTLATASTQVSVTCTDMDDCYCKRVAQQGCLASAANSAPVSKYCASGTCGSCNSGFQFESDRCVQCTANSHCTPSNECMSATCVSNACVQTPRTGSCNGGAGTCSGGLCSSDCRLSADICERLDTRIAAGKENTTADCKVTVRQRTIFNDYSCGTNGQCNSESTDEYEIVEAKNAPDLTSCTANGKAGICQAGVCVPSQCTTAKDCPEDPCGIVSCVESKCKTTAKATDMLCKDLSAGGAVAWEGNLSACTSSVSVCGMLCTSNLVVGHACTQATSGICTAEGTCKTECPFQYPGCMAPNAAMPGIQPTAYGCRQQGQVCYECKPGYAYDTNAEACIPAEYALELPQVSATATEQVIIKPVLRGSGEEPLTNDDRSIQYRLEVAGQTLQTFSDFTFTIPEPGAYPAVVVALQARTGRTLASATQTMMITCPPNDPCCMEGATQYKSDGAACTDNGLQGTCQERTCITACTRKSSVESGNLCNNGIDDDCNGDQDCADASCAVYCPTKVRCDQGELVCGGACTDTSRSNKHCGACGNKCAGDEQCMKGSCVQVEGCQIVCNSDRDCRQGEICANPGDCKASYCAPSNILIASPQSIDRITQEIADEKTHTLLKELRGDELRLTVRNHAPVPLRNFTIVVNFNLPSEVLPAASDLSADHTFTVIKDETVIEFLLPQVNAEQTVTITMPRDVDPSLAQSIYVDTRHAPIAERPITLSPQQALITTNYVKESGRVKLLLGIDPEENLEGVRIPIEIPKCLLESAANMSAAGDGTYEVIKDDPLIVWSLQSVKDKQALEIEVGEASRECRDGLTAFAVADVTRRPSNPWLPLLIIPVIGFVILFFQRFHARKEQMSRDEFERVAREQGTPPEQLEQAWREYNNKW